MSVSKSGNAYKTGSCYGNSQSITTGNENTSLNHVHGIPDDSGPDHSQGFVWSARGQGNLNHNTGYCGELNHTHSATFTPSITDNIGVTDNISVSMSDGDVETRPENFTIKIWKRVS